MSIAIRSLTKSFDGHMLFYNLDLDIRQGCITALTGVSGCGKTTLLRMIAGLDRHYTGQITGVPEMKSVMFQEDRLLPWYDVRKNIEFVLKDAMSKEQITPSVDKMIAAVGLSGHEHKKPDTLSGGMQRRVALARAFCYPSDFLLMDEPFKGFDVKLNLELISLFESLYANSNRTVLLVVHEQDLIDRLGCDVINVESISVSGSISAGSKS